MRDGRRVEHHTRFPSGTRENPLSTDAVNAKARDLMTPVLGAGKAEKLIEQVNTLERLDDVRWPRSLLVA